MKPPIHPLRRWLFEHQSTMLEFADRIGVSQSYLSEFLRGKKSPSAEVMKRIVAATDGAVTPNDCVAYLSIAPRDVRQGAE